MEFLNIGGGEILVIALLALILFGPEDIVNMMRKIGQFTRRTQQMWRQLSATVQEELDVSELEEAVAEVKATTAEAQEALNEIGASVREVSEELERNVSQTQRELKAQADESAAALKEVAAEKTGVDETQEVISDLNSVVSETQQALALAQESMDNVADKSAEQVGGTQRDVPEPSESAHISPEDSHSVSLDRKLAPLESTNEDESTVPGDASRDESQPTLNEPAAESSVPTDKQSDVPPAQEELSGEGNTDTSASAETESDDPVPTGAPRPQG